MASNDRKISRSKIWYMLYSPEKMETYMGAYLLLTLKPITNSNHYGREAKAHKSAAVLQFISCHRLAVH